MLSGSTSLSSGCHVRPLTPQLLGGRRQVGVAGGFSCEEVMWENVIKAAPEEECVVWWGRG